MTTALTLSERALRGQLIGKYLTPSELGQLWGRPEVAERFQRACEAREIPFRWKTREEMHLDIWDVPGIYSGTWRQVSREVPFTVLEGYLIGADAILNMPKSLTDDLPLLEEAPAVMAWLGIAAGGFATSDGEESARESDLQAINNERARGGNRETTRFIHGVLEVGAYRNVSDAEPHVLRAIKECIQRGQTPFDDVDTEGSFLYTDGRTPGTLTRKQLNRRITDWFSSERKRAA